MGNDSSVPIIASAWTQFHKLNKEDFTSIIIQAIAMSKLIKDFNNKDAKRLTWLRDNTHKDIERSMFELDRYVDKTKGRVSNNKYGFSDGTYFTQDEIQNFLCLAVSEVYEIIYRNFKDYKVEEKLNIDNEIFNTDKKW